MTLYYLIRLRLSILLYFRQWLSILINLDGALHSIPVPIVDLDGTAIEVITVEVDNRIVALATNRWCWSVVRSLSLSIIGLIDYIDVFSSEVQRFGNPEIQRSEGPKIRRSDSSRVQNQGRIWDRINDRVQDRIWERIWDEIWDNRSKVDVTLDPGWPGAMIHVSPLSQSLK